MMDALVPQTKHPVHYQLKYTFSYHILEHRSLKNYCFCKLLVPEVVPVQILHLCLLLFDNF